MTKLTDLQLVLLSTACQHNDGGLLPLPPAITAPPSRLTQAMTTLVKRGLAADLEVVDPALAYRSADDRHYGAAITANGRAALGIKPTVVEPVVTEPVTAGPTGVEPAATEAPGTGMPVMATASAPAGATTKTGRVLAMLRADGGTSLAELVEATGWLPHTTRAALTGLRKKGHDITRDKVDGVTRYTLATVA